MIMFELRRGRRGYPKLIETHGKLWLNEQLMTECFQRLSPRIGYINRRTNCNVGLVLVRQCKSYHRCAVDH